MAPGVASEDGAEIPAGETPETWVSSSSSVSTFSSYARFAHGFVAMIH